MELQDEVKNIKVSAPAKAKFLEVIRTHKAKRGIKPLQSEMLTIISDHYLTHVLNTEAA